MTNIEHMTLAEQLRELQRFHDSERGRLVAANAGRVDRNVSYHAYLSDAAARAASLIEVSSKSTG